MSERMPSPPNLGVVVIGRNEGERLRRCLESIVRHVRLVVYVDSGSTDGSVQMARGMGAVVVELDSRRPFNAGRARTEGFRHLHALLPDLQYVQFVDGDCEVVEGWLGKAVAFLDANPDVAVVAGRRRERYPERSLYNLFCAIEWDSHPVGEAQACGGDAMMRVAPFTAVGGYRFDLVAGEEPELCLRLRAAGWRIWFLPLDLTLHDAAMTRFGQFWRRAVRSGYGCIQGVHLHGAPPEYYCVRGMVSAWFWAVAIPLATLLLMPFIGAWALTLLLIYPVQVVRLALLGRRRRLRENWWWAVFAVVIKFPNFVGQVRCLTHQIFHRHPQLIEYKS